MVWSNVFDEVQYLFWYGHWLYILGILLARILFLCGIARVGLIDSVFVLLRRGGHRAGSFIQFTFCITPPTVPGVNWV